MYQARLQEDDLPAPEKFYPLFPKELFDYSFYEEDHLLRLKNDIPHSVLCELRNAVLDICGVGNESTRTNLEEKQLFSFQKYDSPFRITLDGTSILLNIDYYLIYLSPDKFYTEDGLSMLEINFELTRLLHHALGENKYKFLVQSFITQ